MNISQYSLLSFLYGAYFLFCAIPHTPALRYILLTLTLLLGFYMLYQNRHNLEWRSPIFITTGALLSVAIVSALISPYPSTFSALRKDYLAPSLLILIPAALPWPHANRQYFFRILILCFSLGFCTKTLLALWDGAINNPYVFSPYSNPDFYEKNGGLPTYLDFFAIDASQYIPIMFGIALFGFIGKQTRWFLLLNSLIAYGIILLSGVRSAFLVSSFSICMLLLYRFVKPTRLIVLILALVAACVVVSIHLSESTQETNRYLSLFRAETYSKEQGMSGRYPLWAATYEIAEHRPWFGFGPGWKKLPTVAQDLGLLDIWRTDPSAYGQIKTSFFSLAPGKTNPHNLFAQLLFEIGRVGLLSYLLLLAALCFSAWRLSLSKQITLTTSRWLVVTVPIFTLCSLALSVTNGIFLPPPLVVLLISIAVLSNKPRMLS